MLRPRCYLRVRLPLSLVISALLLVPGAVFADTTITVGPAPLPALFNPCTGESVVGGGRFRQVVTSNLTPDGNTNLNIHTDEYFAGMGALTGINYVSSHTDDLSDTGHGTTFKMDEITTLPIVSQGPTPNFFLHIVDHVTVVDGVPTANTFDFDMDCNG